MFRKSGKKISKRCGRKILRTRSIYKLSSLQGRRPRDEIKGEGASFTVGEKEKHYQEVPGDLTPKEVETDP